MAAPKLYYLSALRQPRLGEWVQATRKAVGFRTYREAGLASGLSAATWQQLESGRDLRVKTLVKVLEFLELHDVKAGG